MDPKEILLVVGSEQYHFNDRGPPLGTPKTL